jgi:hypothetical protein
MTQPTTTMSAEQTQGKAMNLLEEWQQEVNKTLDVRHKRYFEAFDKIEQRLAKLEAPCDKEALATQLKSQAAQQQALGNAAQQQAQVSIYSLDVGNPNEALYAPLRSDTKPLIDLAAFARRLLNPDDLGHAVTKEVRDSARRALGMPEVREYDL